MADKGILHDPSPYELDPNAWSAGANMRFHANKAERAPIFRDVYDTLPEEPIFCVNLETETDFDSIVIVGADGRSFQYIGGTVVESTPTAGFTPEVTSSAFTSTYLGSVLYLNNPAYLPQCILPGAGNFSNLPNQECAWKCRSLRAFGDYLIALNVTKPTSFVDPFTGITQQGGSFPNLFKWSDLTLNGQAPGSWDPDNPNISAGENPLEELSTPLVDGLTMRGIFVAYSEDQIWAVQQTGTEAVFTFSKLFNEGGMLAPNCGVEVDGVHYVFGPKDIYKHDGVQKVSIIDKRNKQWLYRNLNKSLSEVCFVAYAQEYDSIFFGFNCGDSSCYWPGEQCDRCNYAAVYDLSADTWSFIDLPNVSSLTDANLDSVLTYATAGATTYATVGGSYYDQDNTFVKHLVGVSGAVPNLISGNRMVAYDFYDKGSLSFPYLGEINAPPVLTRTGIALDQEGSDLTTYKKVRRLFPLIDVFNNALVQIQVGGSNTPSGPVTWGPKITFNPATQYKIDGIEGGRYLALMITCGTPDDFEVSGYDMDVSNGGRR